MTPFASKKVWSMHFLKLLNYLILLSVPGKAPRKVYLFKTCIRVHEANKFTPST